MLLFLCRPTSLLSRKCGRAGQVHVYENPSTLPLFWYTTPSKQIMAGPAGRVGHEHDTRSNRRAAAKIGAERKLVAAFEKLTNREKPLPGAEAGRSFDEDSVKRALAGDIPVEIREELAGSCAHMAAPATENDPAKRLRWALKGRNFVNNHHLAIYEEACALHDLEYFKAAVDRFKSLRVDIDGGNHGNLTKNMVDDVKRRTTRPTDIDIKVARRTNGEQPEITNEPENYLWHAYKS